MKLVQAIFSGHHKSLIRVLRARNLCASPTDEKLLASRNYANNLTEYNHVFGSLSNQRRFYLLRDVYDDMILDGVQPSRDSFHNMIAGTMRGSRMQDALFFRDEMKAMGLVPDVALYNFLIATCGKCKNSNVAVRILDEMKINLVKPNGQTYICLLNACAASGRIDRVYAIVRDMTAAGLGLNKFCYAGLIAAHKNKTPVADETTSKIIELVEQSKGWSSNEASSDSAENVMMGVSEEELYSVPTAEFVKRRGFPLNKQLTVFHVAFHACADLKSIETTETLLEMLKREGKVPDTYIEMQVIRCYLHCGDIDRGLKAFEEFISTRPPLFSMAELYATFIEGAMVGYTPRGMQLVEERLTGGYTSANIIWDMIQNQNIRPTFAVVEAYFNGLKARELPADDPRLLAVSQAYDITRPRSLGFNNPPVGSVACHCSFFFSCQSPVLFGKGLMVRTCRQAKEIRVQNKMNILQEKYFGKQSLSLPTPIPVPPTFHGMTWDEMVEVEEDYDNMWRFHHVVVLASDRLSCLRMLAEDAVEAKDEKAGVTPGKQVDEAVIEPRVRRDNIARNPKHNDEGKRKDVSAAREDADVCHLESRGGNKSRLSSSHNTHLFAEKERDISCERKSCNFERGPPLPSELPRINKALSSGVRVSAGIADCCSSSTEVRDVPVIDVSATEMEAGEFFCCPEPGNEVKWFSKYKRCLDGSWGCYLSHGSKWFRTIVRDNGDIEHYEVPSLKKWKKGKGIGQDVEVSYYNETEPEPKCAADTSSLFDVVGREGTELNQVLGELSIRREKRLNSTVAKIQRGHQNRAMATPSSLFKAATVVPAPVGFFDNALKRGRKGSKTLAEIVTPEPLAPITKDVVDVKAVAKESADLMRRDPSLLSMKIQSSISHLAASCQGVFEVLMSAHSERAAAEAETAALIQQLKDQNVQLEKEKIQLEGKKLLEKEQFEAALAKQRAELIEVGQQAAAEVVEGRNHLVNRCYHWGLSAKEVELSIVGGYEKVNPFRDDASPAADPTVIPEKTHVPLSTNASNLEEIVRLRGRVSELEKSLSRARDNFTRTQQAQNKLEYERRLHKLNYDKIFSELVELQYTPFVHKSCNFRCQELLSVLTLYLEAEVDSERGLKVAYLVLLTERGIVTDPSREKFLAQEARNRHSVEAHRCSARAGVSVIWGDELADKQNELFGLSTSFNKSNEELQKCLLAADETAILNSKLESNLFDLQNRLNAVIIELSQRDADIVVAKESVEAYKAVLKKKSLDVMIGNQKVLDLNSIISQRKIDLMSLRSSMSENADLVKKQDGEIHYLRGRIDMLTHDLHAARASCQRKSD
ncbi:hypothetical protein GIB67_003701 [Kingdonia uniflora]|uniref:Pentatricopeptide repeat-containing protein n=1 Tax=Kingdonia uniflora TaxID=39325 RepID=A0A7J7M3U9_9MAGN|nr:hypothetical protein GIB67_003701 [Kingdonia uniflora]